MWPWATALTGLAVSVAGNIGHIQPLPGHPVVLADRLTAATSPLAAFAGLTVGQSARPRLGEGRDRRAHPGCGVLPPEAPVGRRWVVSRTSSS